MAYASDSQLGTGAAQDQAGAQSKESLEIFFFNMFNDRFMCNIDPTRQRLEQKFPAMLSEIVENLHKVSAHAADMIYRQGITFKDLGPEAQEVFLSEFLRQIDSFADKVRESFEDITPEQEQKLLAAYAKKSTTDN